MGVGVSLAVLFAVLFGPNGHLDTWVSAVELFAVLEQAVALLTV